MRCTQSGLILGAAVAGVWLSISIGRAQDDRTAVPPEADITKAQSVIKDLFKADYAKTKPSDRSAFAIKLMKQAEEAKDDNAARYVLLREARDLAARAGDGVTSLRAAEELAQEFQVESGKVRAAVADLIAANALSPAAARSATEALISAADSARLADDIPSEVILARAAENAARKSQSIAASNAARNRLKEAELLKAESDKIKEHLATLASNPNDPAANLAVGRYRFGIRQDWEGAMAHFAKGSDEKMKDIATKDQQAEKAGELERLAMADQWYDLIASLEGIVKTGAQIRAHYWYSKSLPGLSGLNKIKAEKRISELQSIVDTKGDRTKLWINIRRAIAESQVKKWDLIGGVFARQTFEELPPNGGILIGFHYTTLGNGNYPGVVQAIYLTSQGEALGIVYGVPEKGAKSQTVKAKPGYAVGALIVRGGGGFDAFKPVFMRMTDKGLNTEDSYEGPQIGGQGGSEGLVGGDGNFIIGLHGKVGDRTKMETMSPITLTTEAATTPLKLTPKRRKNN